MSTEHKFSDRNISCNNILDYYDKGAMITCQIRVDRVSRMSRDFQNERTTENDGISLSEILAALKPGNTSAQHLISSQKKTWHNTTSKGHNWWAPPTGSLNEIDDDISEKTDLTDLTDLSNISNIKNSSAATFSKFPKIQTLPSNPIWGGTETHQKLLLSSVGAGWEGTGELIIEGEEDRRYPSTV